MKNLYLANSMERLVTFAQRREPGTVSAKTRQRLSARWLTTYGFS
jgi:hypothetical protein